MLGGIARWIGFLTMTVVAAGAVLLAVGFLWFVGQIPTQAVQLNRTADGIVVLTGAAERIPDAVELLAAGSGKRLLITGVNRAISAREIAHITPHYTKYFTCCVDLDYTALNTYGNALQARRWAHEHDFNSLIVVTSNWHMPRAMSEIEHQLPDVTLIAYPVISQKLKLDPWWSDLATARLLFGEYLKYLFAQMRMHVDSEG
jgi:uncharacterized SAM-binding protein YcdF (DUF218 family)